MAILATVCTVASRKSSLGQSVIISAIYIASILAVCHTFILFLAAKSSICHGDSSYIPCMRHIIIAPFRHTLLSMNLMTCERADFMSE